MKYRIKGFLIYLAVRFIGLTWRIKIINPHGINPRDNKNQKIIFPFWHGRLLVPIYHYRNTGTYGIISRSNDGEILSEFSSRLGYSLVRGSSSRDGKRAFIRLRRAMRNGHNIGIAPDGPRGPARKVQMGVIELARQEGLMIVPLTFAASGYKKFSSWDGFVFPKPFSRIVMIFGEVIFVNNESEELELKRKELENELNRITDEADGYYKKKLAIN
ncbi:MAG: lysophospholipid acyltransferase family protein [bacterium]